MLRIPYRMKPRRLPHSEGAGSGPQGRLNKMRRVVTHLVRYERVEGRFAFMSEARGYAELLIQEAVRNGDKHPPTMKLADYWLKEKDLVHKLFKVLVPRFSSTAVASTNIWNLPAEKPAAVKMAVLELKGNAYPPVKPVDRDVRGSLVNILLDAAKQEHRQKRQQLGQNRQLSTDSEQKTHPGRDSVNSVTEELENLSVDSSNISRNIPKEGTPV